MSNPVYSASIVCISPVLTKPTIANKQLSLSSTITAEDNSTATLSLNFWAGAEPRVAQLGDVVLVCGVARAVYANSALSFMVSANMVNVIVPAEDAGCVDPASDVTAIFHLLSHVIAHEGEWQFVLEPGNYESSVCHSLHSFSASKLWC
jgi:hypothetical protein